jgi:hypothetical protein
MKMTVEVSEALLARAREHCVRHGISLSDLVEQGIRRSLEDDVRLKAFGFGGEGACTNDWETIRELIYEGRGGTSR